LTLRNLYDYIDMRLYSFNKAKFKEFADYTVIAAHVKDYCDTSFDWRVAKLNSFPFRMRKYSEPLLIAKLYIK
jgi:hypothetical protein